MSIVQNNFTKYESEGIRKYLFLILLVELFLPIFGYVVKGQEKLWQAGFSLGKFSFWLLYFLLFLTTTYFLLGTYRPKNISLGLNKLILKVYSRQKILEASILVLIPLLGATLAIIFFLEQPILENPGYYYLFYGYEYFHLYFYLFGLILLISVIFLQFDLFQFADKGKKEKGLSLLSGIVIGITATLIIVLIIFLLFTTHLILFHIPFETVFNSWFLSYKPEIPPIRIKHMALVVGLFTVVMAVLLFGNFRRKWIWLFVLGVGLQFSFPLVQDASLIRTEYRIGHYGSGTYIKTTCEFETFGDYYNNFEEVSEGNNWLITKPPGYLAPLFFFKNILSVFEPSLKLSSEECVTRLQSFLKYSSPFISMLGLLIIFHLSRFIYPKEQTFLPGLIYILMPNMILFSGIIDQYLIPTPFIILVFLSVLTVKKQKLIYACLTGIWYYICVLYSFSLVGIFGFPLILIGIDYLSNITPGRLKRAALLIVALVGTTLVCELILQFITDYSTFDLLSRSLQSHYSQIKVLDPLGQLWANIKINNIEYLFWIGPPVAILALVGIFYASISEKIKNKDDKVVFVLAGVLFYVLVNVSGQNKAETARLWIFLNPLFALIAPLFIADMDIKTQRVIIVTFIVLQLSLTYLYNLPFYDLFQDGIQIK